jgi:hypothetical protein
MIPNELGGDYEKKKIIIKNFSLSLLFFWSDDNNVVGVIEAY